METIADSASPDGAGRIAKLLRQLPENALQSGVLRNWGWIEGPVALAWLERHPNTADPSEFREL
ncbi:MAG: hypothetical protein H0X73_00815 [Chthoniobacterales bacterium]|jgi:hypothetical protein|nr:hypothetical protein [Chthoniobacterales bacterium]